MTVQFSCDRCKQPFEQHKFTGELPEGLKPYGPFHLCVNCAGKVKSFIEESARWHKSDE